MFQEENNDEFCNIFAILCQLQPWNTWLQGWINCLSCIHVWHWGCGHIFSMLSRIHAWPNCKAPLLAFTCCLRGKFWSIVFLLFYGRGRCPFCWRLQIILLSSWKAKRNRSPVKIFDTEQKRVCFYYFVFEKIDWKIRSFLFWLLLLEVLFFRFYNQIAFSFPINIAFSISSRITRELLFGSIVSSNYSVIQLG